MCIFGAKWKIIDKYELYEDDAMKIATGDAYILRCKICGWVKRVEV